MNDQTRVLGVAAQQPAEAVAWRYPIPAMAGGGWYVVQTRPSTELNAEPLYAAAQPPSPPAPSAQDTSDEGQAPVGYGCFYPDGRLDHNLVGIKGDCEYWRDADDSPAKFTVGPIYARPTAPPQPPVPEPSADAVREASNDGVICPGCAHQFRAIPVNVQALLLLAGFSPPFLESTAPHAVRDVLAERRRQTEAEGWTLGHDDGHDDGALSMAAAGYALEASEAILNCAHELTGPGEPSLDDVQGGTPSAAVWPAGWEFKPATPRRMLVKAGALILAEIERLDRAALAASPKEQP